MIGSPQHKPRRTSLFLVRLWSAEGPGHRGDLPDGSASEISIVAPAGTCYGSVQRAKDGESHQFNSWQELVDLLLALLPNK